MKSKGVLDLLLQESTDEAAQQFLRSRLSVGQLHEMNHSDDNLIDCLSTPAETERLHGPQREGSLI